MGVTGWEGFARLGGMQITVEIPDAVAELAKAEGKAPESFVVELVERKIESVRAAKRPIDVERFFEEIDRLSDGVPALPSQTWDRASIYQDHD